MSKHKSEILTVKVLLKIKLSHAAINKISTLLPVFLKNVQNGCMTENTGRLLFRGGFRTAATSKIERFAIIVNGLQLLSQNAPS